MCTGYFKFARSVRAGCIYAPILDFFLYQKILGCLPSETGISFDPLRFSVVPVKVTGIEEQDVPRFDAQVGLFFLRP